MTIIPRAMATYYSATVKDKPAAATRWERQFECAGGAPTSLHSEATFNYDFGASFTKEQQSEVAKQVLAEFTKDPRMAIMAASCGTDVAGYVTTEAPGLNAFALEDGALYHAYSADLRELGFMVFFEQLLERAPKGGKEGVPIGRNDEYQELAAAGERSKEHVLN